MTRQPARFRPRLSVPNLAPMVDVVMVILIFFMLGTHFALSEGLLPMRLPKQVGPGGGARVAVVPAVRISLVAVPDDAMCGIEVMGRPLEQNTFHALRELLVAKRQAGADPNGPVFIHTDPDVRHQHLVSALDACAAAGMTNIQLAVGVGARLAPAAKRRT